MRSVTFYRSVSLILQSNHIPRQTQKKNVFRKVNRLRATNNAEFHCWKFREKYLKCVKFLVRATAPEEKIGLVPSRGRRRRQEQNYENENWKLTQKSQVNLCLSQKKKTKTTKKRNHRTMRVFTRETRRNFSHAHVRHCVRVRIFSAHMMRPSRQWFIRERTANRTNEWRNSNYARNSLAFFSLLFVSLVYIFFAAFFFIIYKSVFFFFVRPLLRCRIPHSFIKHAQIIVGIDWILIDIVDRIPVHCKHGHKNSRVGSMLLPTVL